MKRHDKRMRRVWRSILPVVALVAMVATQFGTAFAATNVFYLGSDGVPQASLTQAAPTTETLPNLDPGRDHSPGLLLKVTRRAHGETDPTRYQQWVLNSGPLELQGPATLTFWAAMKDFRTEKAGTVSAFLLDCDTSGSACMLIETATASADPWAVGSETWVRRTVGFGTVDHTIEEGRSLALKLVVDNQSEGNMWIAYDAAEFPSSLTIQTAPPPTTTTTTEAPPPPPTTTTTTTTTPPTTTTEAPPPPPPTTTTTTPPTTTTTTNPPLEEVAPPPPTKVPPGPDPSPPTTTIPDRIETEPSPSFDHAGAIDDVALGPLPTSDTKNDGGGLSGLLLGGLELVIPPSVASSLLSPLLLLESVFAAFAETGRGLLIPGLLLAIMVLWTEIRRRRDSKVTPDAAGSGLPA